MSKIQIQPELRAKEDKLRYRYSKLSIILFFISLIFILWVVIAFLGATIWDYGYNWALIPVDIWMYVLSTFLVFVILLNLFLYSRFLKTVKKRVEGEKPKPEYINGKRVNVFTHPQGKEGGIFSKTYIELDNNSVLRLRSCIIPPKELWSQNK